MRKRYVIVGLLMIIGLMVICYPLLKKQTIPLLFHFHPYIESEPNVATHILPLDLSKVNVNELHAVKVEQDDGLYIIDIVKDNVALHDMELPVAWMLQLGRFSTQDNAVRLSESLQKAGYPAFIMSEYVDKIPQWTVLVGPDLNKAALEKNRDKIRETFLINGLMMPYQLQSLDDNRQISEKIQ